MKLLLVGDAPNLPTGLGRIARDLASLVHTDPYLRMTGGLEVAQLGLGYDGSPWPWRVFPVNDRENWGEKDIGQVCEWWFGREPGVVLSVWDPGRCYGLVKGLEPAWRAGLSWRLWGYFAVDADNRKGALGGPVPEALGHYEKVLAYGRWGAGVLRRTTGKPVQYLPHGVDTGLFSSLADGVLIPGGGWSLQESWRRPAVSGAVRQPIVGVVAVNQPRKDYGLLFEALAGLGCRLWVHVDQLITYAWSIPELAELTKRDNLEGLEVTTFLRDDELARAYAQCDATVGIGLGEGFGYPLVESLACGTPVVHVNYGGGAELVPRSDWRVEPQAFRLEGAYAMRRPVLNPQDLREVLREAVRWKRQEPEVCRAYCSGAVAHLGWRELWPRWRGWIAKGMAEPMEVRPVAPLAQPAEPEARE